MEKSLPEMFQNWTPEQKQDFYCTWYSTYLGALDANDERLSELYRRQCALLREMFGLSVADVAYLEARAARHHAWAKEFLQLHGGVDFDAPPEVETLH
jgi:hypothetical protein